MGERIMKSDEEIIAELKRQSKGLLYMSESDYPFEIVYWKGLSEISAQYLSGLTGQPADTPVVIVDVDEFFRGKMPGLERVLRDNLEELKVYRVGRINIPVYIVGRTKAGNWLGVSTRVVET
jgi:hypothetical protein